HDATAGTALAGAAEVVCHPDLGQHNIVFVGNDAKAIIDWDEDVAPGPRILDFAHAVWCLAEVGRQGGTIEEQARRARLLCDAYGWDDPPAVIDEIEARFRRAIVWNTATRKPGAVRIFTDLADWMESNGPLLKGGAVASTGAPEAASPFEPNSKRCFRWRSAEEHRGCDPVIPSEVLVENERQDDERPQQVAREEWWKLRCTGKLTVDRADLRV